MSNDDQSKERIVLRAVFFPRFFMFIGASAFLTISTSIYLLTKEVSGFSLIAGGLSVVLLVSLVRSLGLSLVLTRQSILQNGVFDRWEIQSVELKSWSLIRGAYDRSYKKIVVASASQEHSLSRWIVTGNSRYAQVLEWLRVNHGSKEV